MKSPTTVVRAYLKAFAFVGIALALGWLVGYESRRFFGAASPTLTLVVQLVSSGMIIAATPGFLVDVETRTPKNTSAD